MSASPVPYFGGKQTLGPRIAAALPAHRHYVEPFAGSLAVLFAKAPSAMETVNDLDGDLVGFWRLLRDRPQELARVCALTPHAREEHQGAYERDGCDELERARRLWVRLTQGRGSVPVRSGWRHYITPAGSTGLPAYLLGYVNRMAAAAARLHHVSLECRPALEVIDRYGRDPQVLLYADPPYLGSTRASGADDRRGGTRRYQHEMLTDTEHRDLAAALLACRASVVISGYPSPLYDQLYRNWDQLPMPASTGQGGTWANRTEVLWSNRPLGTQPGLWEQFPTARKDPAP